MKAGAYNEAGVDLLLLEPVVQPDKLIVEAGDLKVLLLEALKGRLKLVKRKTRIELGTFVCTVNFTTSCSFNASAMETFNDSSKAKSTTRSCASYTYSSNKHG